MLTLEEAIRPILDEEDAPGYGPVSAREGKHHWFVMFGFDGLPAPGDTPYAIDKETGEVDYFPAPPLPVRGGEATPIEKELMESREVPADLLPQGVLLEQGTDIAKRYRCTYAPADGPAAHPRVRCGP